MSDESDMIRHLELHLKIKNTIIAIGKQKGINVEETTGNDPRGDFIYAKEDENKLIEGIDEYLGCYKYLNEGEED